MLIIMKFILILKALRVRRITKLLMLKQNYIVYLKMAYQMVEAHNSALEFITPEIQVLPKNRGLNQKGSQLNQNLCL